MRLTHTVGTRNTKQSKRLTTSESITLTDTHLQQANRDESLIEAFQWAKIVFHRKEKQKSA